MSERRRVMELTLNVGFEVVVEECEVGYEATFAEETGHGETRSEALTALKVSLHDAVVKWSHHYCDERGEYGG